MSEGAFRIATYNANSIRSRMEPLAAWLERYRPDVLCIQETKVQDPDFPTSAFTDLGYTPVFRGQKAHAGVAILAVEPPAEVSYGFVDGDDPDEPRLIRATVRGIPIVNTYVPQGRAIDSPHFEYKLKWFDRLLDLFRSSYDPEKPLVWVGDLNVAPDPIDVYDPVRLAKEVDFHPAAREALEKVRGFGFVDVFRKHRPGAGEYSYFDYRIPNAQKRNLGWRIDHIWATPPLAERSTDAWIDYEARMGERPSDHTYVVADFRWP